MEEISNAVKRILVYTGLLLLSVLTTNGLYPHRISYTGSTAYFVTFGALLIFYYHNKIAGNPLMKNMLISMALMMLLWFIFRGLRYSLFVNEPVMRRFMWYLYYIPELIIPLLTFFMALTLDIAEGEHIPREWYGLVVIIILVIACVLTNDFHQQVFAFNAGFVNWETEYAYGPAFIMIQIIMYGLYIAAFVLAMIKCSNAYSRKCAVVIAVPIAIGIFLLLLLVLGKLELRGETILNTTEIACYMIITITECCIQIGLIPSNNDPYSILQACSLAAQITDKEGNRKYWSYTATKPTKRWVECEDNVFVEGDTIVKKYGFKNAIVFWQEDVSEINDINDSLQETNERLSEEVEFLRLENELKEKNVQLETHNAIYDVIEKQTKPILQKIYDLSSEDTITWEQDIKDARFICFMGAFLKRYSNLMMLAAGKDELPATELGLALSESLRYLNYMGIPGEYVPGTEKFLPGKDLIKAYEIFEKVLESVAYELKGVLVRLYETGDSPEGDVILKLTLEGLTEESLQKHFDMAEFELATTYICEDDVTYLRIYVKGGNDNDDIV